LVKLDKHNYFDGTLTAINPTVDYNLQIVQNTNGVIVDPGGPAFANTGGDDGG